MTAAAKLENLIELRKQMQRPADMVIISVCGRLRTGNPLIVVEDHEDVKNLDVRGLAALDVEIAHIGKNLKRVQDLVWQAWKGHPSNLFTCNYLNGQTIHVGAYGKVYNQEVV